MPVSYHAHRVQTGMFFFYVKSNYVSNLVSSEPTESNKFNGLGYFFSLIILSFLLVNNLYHSKLCVSIIFGMTGVTVLSTFMFIHFPICVALSNLKSRHLNCLLLVNCLKVLPIFLLVPGFTSLCIIPNLTHLLLNSGDIESNPGPAPIISSKDLRILYENINSLSANDGRRFDSFQATLNHESIDIALICESGCFSNNDLEKYAITNFHDPYHLYRGRGTMVYIRNTLPFKIRTDLMSNQIECIWLNSK